MKMLYIRSQHLKRPWDERGLQKITKEQGSAQSICCSFRRILGNLNYFMSKKYFLDRQYQFNCHWTRVLRYYLDFSYLEEKINRDGPDLVQCCKARYLVLPYRSFRNFRRIYRRESKNRQKHKLPASPHILIIVQIWTVQPALYVQYVHKVLSIFTLLILSSYDAGVYNHCSLF